MNNDLVMAIPHCNAGPETPISDPERLTYEVDKMDRTPADDVANLCNLWFHRHQLVDLLYSY